MSSVIKALFEIALILFAGVLLQMSCLAADEDQPPRCAIQGVVQAYRLNVREKPSENAPVVVTLERGARFWVVAGEIKDGAWLSIAGPGVTGYVRNRPRYIRLLDADAPNPEHVETLKQDIAIVEEVLEKNIRKESDVLEELDRLDRSLDDIRKRLASLSLEQERLSGELTEIGLERERLETLKITKARYAHARLNALYRMTAAKKIGQSGPPDSLNGFLFRARALGMILDNDFKVLSDYVSLLQSIEGLERDLEETLEEKAISDRNLCREEYRLTEKRETRSGFLERIRSDRQLMDSAVAALKQAGDYLDQRLKAMSESPSSGEPDPEAFSALQNELEMPVKGIIITGYGPSQNSDYSSFTFQSGIDIRVDRGEPVMSVFRGSVLFAQWLKGYGNLIIIDHGENYYTLYAHVEEIFKKKGDRVDTREVIATAGDTGSVKGPCLHFEVRHRGKPEDPLKWLKKGV